MNSARTRPLVAGPEGRLPLRKSTANAQSAITCDRECLRGKVTQLLYAFLKHDVSKLPVSDMLRVTEDAAEKPLGKVGLVRTVTRLRGFRQDIIDERAGLVRVN